MSILLSERSFEEVTVDDVAQRAGVSRGTIYTYFPDGRDQLLRDAYLRIAERVTESGISERAQHTAFADRVVALASVLARTAASAEGRFYGMIGPGILGPLSGVTGTASRRFLSMLQEDLTRARDDGLLASDTPVSEIAALLSGSLREIGVVAAREPERVPALLGGLRYVCDALRAPSATAEQ